MWEADDVLPATPSPQLEALSSEAMGGPKEEELGVSAEARGSSSPPNPEGLSELLQGALLRKEFLGDELMEEPIPGERKRGTRWGRAFCGHS